MGLEMGPVGTAEFTLRGQGWGKAGDMDKSCVWTDVRLRDENGSWVGP